MSIDEHFDDIEVIPDFTSTLDQYLEQIDYLDFGYEIRTNPDGSIHTFKATYPDSTFEILFSTIEDELSVIKVRLLIDECIKNISILSKRLIEIESPSMISQIAQKIKIFMQSLFNSQLTYDQFESFRKVCREFSTMKILHSVLISVLNQKLAVQSKSTLS